MSIPSESSLLQNEVQILNVKLTGPGGDNVLWPDIADLSDHCPVKYCRRWRFGFVNGQVSLAWSIALRTQELYTGPRVLKERWREVRTGSRSLNFFQAVFTCVVVKVHSHLLLRACLLGNKRKLPPQACQVQPGLPSVICHPMGVQFPGTLYICSQGLLSSA